MARAHSVWVPIGPHGPLGAFTVKHEFLRWLSDRLKAHPFDPISAWRYHDGAPGRERRWFPAAELKEMLK